MAVLFGLIWEVYRNEGFEVVDVTYEESVDYLLYVENTCLTGETGTHRNSGHNVPNPYGKARLKPGQSYSAYCRFVGFDHCRL
jgi:hypothetical protein